MEALVLQQFTYRIQGIEVNLVNGGNVTKIDDQPQLKNAIVFTISALNVADITLTPMTGGTPIAVADFAKASLILVQGSEMKGSNIPLPMLHDMCNATPTPYIREKLLWNRLSISWSLCKVNLLNATWSQAQILTLMVNYAYPEDLGFATCESYFNSLQSKPAIPVATRS